MILYELEVSAPFRVAEENGIFNYGLRIHCVQENEAYHILEPQSMTTLLYLQPADLKSI